VSRRVVVTGAGVAAPSGLGMAAFGRALDEARSLCAPITAFDASGFAASSGGEVPGIEPRTLVRHPKEAKVLARASVLALAALADLQRAVPGPWIGDPWEAGLFLGVGLEQGDVRDLQPPVEASVRGGGKRLSLSKLASAGMDAMNPIASLKTLPNMALAHVAIRLGDAAPRGPNAAYSPFDAASLEAVGAAAAAIRSGECDVALAGGADSALSVLGLLTFHRLGIARASAPMGEGAGLLLLEEADRAAAAGRRPLAEIAGFGSASDAVAIGRAAPERARAAICGAWEDADAPRSAILSGHGTSMPADEQAVRELFEEKPPDLVHPRRLFGEACAGSGALAMLAGLHALVAGGPVLVSAAGFGGSYAAIRLEAAR
jgi:3-oxoacyl-(acyl-carrier-protein) synthase